LSIIYYIFVEEKGERTGERAFPFSPLHYSFSGMKQMRFLFENV
jgi:hypothetical protein